ncbi:hypothetical protein ACFL04_00865 [Patescibacteria group bacterium]
MRAVTQDEGQAEKMVAFGLRLLVNLAMLLSSLAIFFLSCLIGQKFPPFFLSVVILVAIFTILHLAFWLYNKRQNRRQRQSLHT